MIHQPARLRLTNQRLEALQEIFAECIEDATPANAHEVLLKQHMVEFNRMLLKMLERKQELYTLKLSALQATAFVQIWHTMDISHDKYAIVIIENMLNKIDQY